MTDIFEASITALRTHLLTRKDLVERSLSTLQSGNTEYAEDHRRLIRVYTALLRTFEAEAAFEADLRHGYPAPPARSQCRASGS